MKMSYDIAIVGAGIAGSALACSLAMTADAMDKPLRIALIEAQAISDSYPCCEEGINDFDARVSALTAGSQQFLESIGVWSDMARQRVSRFDKMIVWDAEGTGHIEFDATDIRASELGHIVENRVTVAALHQRIKILSGVDVFSERSVAEIDLLATDARPNKSCLTLDDGRILEAQLIVAADGANSPLRTMAEMQVREWSYQQSALVCVVETSQCHEHTAWQRFTAHGPLAFLPLSLSQSDKNYCSIVWSQTDKENALSMAMDDDDFSRALGRAFEHRLGEIKGVSKRFSFPLQQRHAVDYVRPNFALVADAAHAIHPLAGQGINLGLADVKAFSEVILAGHQRGQSLGHIGLLKRYQRQRKADNLAMMAAIEGLKRLFEPLPLPLRWARNVGMNIFHAQSQLKNKVIRHAMGIDS